ncbi:MAG TPA: GNAT family N-acetyltransferase [Vicinamibacterales bacterium]|nr:GNAT family N-acetyltransferase [Vicinamibacterales bacterium]
MRIELLDGSAPASDVDQLAQLLIDTVEAGGSVSFVAPLPIKQADGWWRLTLSHQTSRGVILVAREGDAIVGTVQLQPSWAPNQPHRADVAKLMVHPRARGQGVSRALMTMLEREAATRGFTLLVLDTVRGDPAEALYTSMGWQRVGVIPNFALHPDGRTMCDTVFFYKALAR